MNQISTLKEDAVLDDYLITPMKGTNHSGIAICSAQSDIVLVWQPLRGGEKYHSKSDCGNLDAPRLETLEVAEALGFTQCSRCH